MKRRALLSVFNRGRISRLALARLDVSRVALSAAIQTNWMPRTLGSMSLRPGLEYIGALAGDGALVPFIFTSDDTAILELTASQMGVWDSGTDLLTRPSVSAAISNEDFATDLTDWTDADDSGATSAWATGGYMSLTGTGYAVARRRYALAVTETSTQHALRIVVERGPAVLRVGTTAGGDDVFRQAVLRTGTHSIAFTPGASTVYIEFSSSRKYPVLVSSCSVEASGVVQIPTPWTDAATAKKVRWHQVGDVIFCACDGIRQQRIERRPNGSWSVCDYTAEDGPFLTENTGNITLTPSALSGEITVQSSQNLFREDHIGTLFRITSQGQRVEASLAAENTFTNTIRVTGVGGDRRFDITRGGTWSGTLSLQRSIGAPGAWVTVSSSSSTTPTYYNDGLDNTIAYYRYGFESGNYSSGTADVSLDYPSGSIDGTVRVTGYTSETEVDAVVLSDLGDTDATEIWSEGAWSDVEGWPSAVSGFEGRLVWFGNGRTYASVSDAFEKFDPETEGDSGPINRRIGDGAVNDAKWALPLQRLIVGTSGAENVIRSTSFDEPITPSNYNSKAASTKGSYDAPAVRADGRGYFIGRSGGDIYEMNYSADVFDYSTLDVTGLVPEIGDEGFERLGIQQRPDMRLHAVRGDGSVAVMVRDLAEDVLCWIDIETDGTVEDVTVLPGADEDQVFYSVARTIGGSTVRYLERWAKANECVGGALNKQADSFATGTGSVAGLDHLAGETVVIWGDGADQGTATVAADGTVAGHSYTTWCAGLGYTGRYQSSKLAPQTQDGILLTSRSRIVSVGLVLADTHAQGLQYGPDFDNLDDLPVFENGAEVDGDYIHAAYDEGAIEFPGDLTNDPRVCLVASAPRPATVLAAHITMAIND